MYIWHKDILSGHTVLDLHSTFVGLIAYNYFNFGLIHAEFGGLLPLVEDLHQKVLCFATKVATRALFAMQ